MNWPIVKLFRPSRNSTRFNLITYSLFALVSSWLKCKYALTWEDTVRTKWEKTHKALRTVSGLQSMLSNLSYTATKITGEAAHRADRLHQLNLGDPGSLQDKLVTLTELQNVILIPGLGKERTKWFITQIFQVIWRTEDLFFPHSIEQSLPRHNKGVLRWNFALTILGHVFSLNLCL